MQAGKVYLRMVIETVKAGEWIGLGEWYEEPWTAYLTFYLKRNEREEEAIWNTYNKISLTWVIGTWMFYYSLWFAECSCGRPEFDPWVQKMPWRRERQPTPVFLPGESHGLWSLVGFSPWGHQESDTTERLTLSLSLWHFNGFKMLWYEKFKLSK